MTKLWQPALTTNPNAQREIQDFLGIDSIDEAEITSEVRIILVSANFSPEITASVIWLNKQGLDITCIRLKPYKMGEQVLVDATQIIPLPEAADYEIKIRAQEQEKKKVRGVRQEVFRRFWAQLIERSKLQTTTLCQPQHHDGSLAIRCVSDAVVLDYTHH